MSEANAFVSTRDELCIAPFSEVARPALHDDGEGMSQYSSIRSWLHRHARQLAAAEDQDVLA